MTGKRTVLHVLAPAREGGLERVVTMLALGRVKDGVHVAAVVDPMTARSHPFVARLEALNIPVTAIAVQGKSYLKEYGALRSLISQVSPAIVHTHGYRADVIGGAAAKSLGVTAVSTVHGFTGGGIRNWIYERIQTLMLRTFAGVIAVSEPIVARLEAAGVENRKVHCVRNGFIPEANGVSRLAARERLGIDNDEVVIGWVGRLSREKGADVMLDALALTDPIWRLSIIGDGPESKRLRAHAARLGLAGRVNWHGSVENAGSLLTAFDAFVLSSRTEGTPIALLEAMQAQVPIVATTVGGVPDVVGAEHAILVHSEDAPAIAQAISQLQRDRSAAARRSRAAHDRLQQAFGFTAWLAAIESAYDKAAKPQPGE